MSRKRLLKPDGTPASEAEVARYLAAHPEMVGKINRYGFDEGSALDNLGVGAAQFAGDIPRSLEYLGAHLLELTPKYKNSGLAARISAENEAQEKEYQQMTDGSIAAGVGRFGANFIPGPGMVTGIGKAALTGTTKAIPALKALKNTGVLKRVNQALSQNAARKAQLKAASPAALAHANSAFPEIALIQKGVSGLINNTVKSPRWYVNAPSRGVLGYTLTNAKDENSASLDKILGYGAVGGLVAGSIGKAVGPPLTGVGDRLQKEFEDVRKGFSIPPSARVHAPIGRVLEALAGKNNLATELGIKNTQNAQRLARQEIGLPPSTNPITDIEFELAKQQPSAVYDSVRKLTDAQGNPLRVPIDHLTQRKLFNALAADKQRTASVNNELFKALGQSYPHPTASVSDLMQDVRQWGDMTKAFKKADDNVSASYISQHRKNIENSLSNTLQNAAPGKYAEYLDARKKFAQIRDLQQARSNNEVGEKLNAVKLAGLRAKSGSDKLTGGLKDIADFTGRHPNVAFSAQDSVTLPPINMFGAALRLAGPTAARKILSFRPYQKMSTHPWANKLGTGLAYPFTDGIMPGYWGASLERAFDK